MIVSSKIKHAIQAGAGDPRYARAPAWKFSLDKIAAGDGKSGERKYLR